MIKQIKTVKDVKKFFRQLLGESLNFHPDTPFGDYVNGETGADTYTKEEAKFRDTLLDECFKVCKRNKVDIYELANEIFLKGTGLGKYIQNLN